MAFWVWYYFLPDFALEEEVDDDEVVVEEDVAALSCFSRAVADFWSDVIALLSASKSILSVSELRFLSTALDVL